MLRSESRGLSAPAPLIGGLNFQVRICRSISTKTSAAQSRAASVSSMCRTASTPPHHIEPYSVLCDFRALTWNATSAQRRENADQFYWACLPRDEIHGDVAVTISNREPVSAYAVTSVVHAAFTNCGIVMREYFRSGTPALQTSDLLNRKGNFSYGPASERSRATGGWRLPRRPPF